MMPVGEKAWKWKDVCILSSNLRLKLFDGGRVLIFNHKFELDKYFINMSFGLRGVNYVYLEKSYTNIT